jgi:hypothetical protein
MVTDQLADQDLDGLMPASGVSAGRGLRGNASRRPVLAEDVLDEGATHPEQVRQGTL